MRYVRWVPEFVNSSWSLPLQHISKYPPLRAFTAYTIAAFLLARDQAFFLEENNNNNQEAL